MLEKNNNDMIQDAVYTPAEIDDTDAAAKMEQALYVHAEPQKKKKERRKHSNFKAIVATGLICSLVGGGIGGVIGANSVDVSSSGSGASVQLVGNSGEISPVIAIAQKVTPSIVGVKTYGTYNYWGQQITNQELGSGSGIIFREDGYIVTNYHVIENATSVTVTLNDGTEYDARIVGSDSSSDLAVLKVEANGLPTAEFGDSDELQIGELVVAIGNPLGYENTVTDGIVSGLNRQLTNYTDTMTLIQTNAAINSGNSGGALVNSKGEVVGINSAKLVASNAEGMGFALSINEVKPILEELISKGHVSRPYLGVTINSNYQVDEDTAEKYEIPMGIQIADVVKGGPADKAGLRAGDIIYKVDDTLIQSFEDLSDIIDNSQVGDQLRVLANRNGEKITANVTLTEGNVQG
ncbi:MAG: S1C family serine protease [Peptococcaceae bacterium]